MSASLAGGAAADMAPRPAALRFTPSFYLWHLLPLALLLFALVVAMNGLDQWLADAVFRWEGMQWALRDSPLTRHVIHQLGKRFSTLLWLGFAIALALTWRKPDWRPLRRPLAYVLLAVAISTITVTVIKSLTHMDCPWDLAGLGGQRPFIDLFETRPATLGPAACFPAAHAAGGFAWVALYFFFLRVAPRWRYAGLGIGLLAGMVFGLAQQLRGAHFLSHDVASLAVCWGVACAVEACFGRSGSVPTESRA